VETGVPGRVGVGAELADEADLEAGLFAGFADGGRFERLPVVHEPARQRPAMRRIPAFDQDDAPDPASRYDLDDDVDRGEGIPVLAAGHRGMTPWAIVGAGRSSCQRLGPKAETDGTVLLFRSQSSFGDSSRSPPPGLQAGLLAWKMQILNIV
jgi:hypothetical protein